MYEVSKCFNLRRDGEIRDSSPNLRKSKIQHLWNVKALEMRQVSRYILSLFDVNAGDKIGEELEELENTEEKFEGSRIRSVEIPRANSHRDDGFRNLYD